MSLFLGLYPCLVKEFLNTLGFAWSLGPLFYFIEMDFIFIPKKKKRNGFYIYPKKKKRNGFYIVTQQN